MLNEQLKESFLKNKDPFTDIIGQESAKQGIKSAFLMNRHIIIEGAPGIGKTTLAKNIAKLLPDIDVIQGCSYHCTPESIICPSCKKNNSYKTIKLNGIKRFVRIQGSPDLTVEDLLGDIDPIKALKFGPLSLEAFTPGKIFKANNGVLFFDELNRCPEKLQNALLQVLEEGKATIGSYDMDFDINFIFIGSLHPDEEILIMQNGLINKVKIGKLVDTQIQNYGSNIVNGSEVAKNPEKIYSYSYNPKTGNIGPLLITAFIRHKPTDFIYEINLSKGRKVIVTGKHSVFTVNNGNLIPIKVSDLKMGDKIAIPNKIVHTPLDFEEIDLIPFFKELNFNKIFFVKESNVSEVVENNKILLRVTNNPHQIANYKYFERLPITEVKDTILSELKNAKIGVNGSKNSIKRFLKIDNDLCWLIGFFVAEGFTQKAINNKKTHRYNIWLSNKNLKILERAKKIIFDKFGLLTFIKQDKRTDVYDLTISSLPLFYVFERLFEIPKGSENKKIPKLIFQLNKEKIKHFLSGYIEGDGNYYTNKDGYKLITMSTVSEQLANDIAYLFLIFGKIASIKKIKETRKNYQDYYYIYLCKTNTNDILKMEEDNKYISYEKVVNINKLEIEPTFVYDLEVLNNRSTDNFIGGFGGVLLHNTMNPEDTSTEKLSDVLLDRFDIIFMHFPENIDIEKKIVTMKGKKIADVSDEILTLIIYLVRLLRNDEKLEKKPSIRASIGLYERSQSNALIKGRKNVNIGDVKDVLVSVLSHRIRLKPSVRYLESIDNYITEQFYKHIESTKWQNHLEEEQQSGDYR